MSRNITAILKADPLYSGPDKVLNGQTLVKSDLPFVYMGPAARCATFFALTGTVPLLHGLV